MLVCVVTTVTSSDVAGAAATAARGVTVAVRCCVAGAWTRIKSAKSFMSVSSSLSSKQSPKSGKKSGVSSLTKPDIVLAAAAFANISDTVAAAAAEFFCALVVRLFGLFGLFLGGFDWRGFDVPTDLAPLLAECCVKFVEFNDNLSSFDAFAACDDFVVLGLAPPLFKDCDVTVGDDISLCA